MEAQFDLSEKTLEKLGEAIFIRSERKRQAEEAGQAVDYLKEEGILDD